MNSETPNARVNYLVIRFSRSVNCTSSPEEGKKENNNNNKNTVISQDTFKRDNPRRLWKKALVCLRNATLLPSVWLITLRWVMMEGSFLFQGTWRVMSLLVLCYRQSSQATTTFPRRGAGSDPTSLLVSSYRQCSQATTTLPWRGGGLGPTSLLISSFRQCSQATTTVPRRGERSLSIGL